MKIILGADHGGWQVKEDVKKWLARLRQGYGEVKDMGAMEEIQEDDYVDFAVLVAKELEKNSEAKGILFCRNGFGMVIAANRFSWVRCGLGFDKGAVERGRMDDDINCLAIPADYVDLEKVKEMIEVFLKTKFSEEERYKRRLDNLKHLDTIT
ncbi:RpiB/LacA/LacB family sugar-phosphate isomerase [Patescibacteria group bacterium]|nr:RpiB/LacA/LacB family sugar-phosphate isomerase [Patescibacteria group bacterium]MBU1457418.1 RpiB/LacA/LacB family sugar-phosphate isomerase [Patescibacteria group bacterium]